MQTFMANSRQNKIIALLDKPNTIKALAEACEVNYYTIHSDLRLLEAAGMVQKLPYRDGRNALYQTVWTTDTGKETELVLRLGDNEVSLGKLVPALGGPASSANKIGRAVGGALAHLYLRGYFKSLEQETEITGLNEHQLKSILLAEHQRARSLVKLIEDLLSIPFLWTGKPNPELAKRFNSDENHSKLLEYAVRFNKDIAEGRIKL